MTTKLMKGTRGGQAQAEAYLFVAPGPAANPVEVLQGLAREAVVSWDAVRDSQFAIVLHLHGPDTAALTAQADSLMADRPEIAHHELVLVQEPVLDGAAVQMVADVREAEAVENGGELQPEAATSYLLVDLAEGREAAVYAALFALPEVKVLEATVGGGRLVAVLQASDFDDLRQVISHRVATRPGVLRITEMKVVPRQEMSVYARALWLSSGATSDLIPLLQAAQETFGYVSRESMESISGLTGIPMADIYGVVTFYKQFRLTPRGDYVIKICNGTACHVNGSSMLESTIEDVLGIARDETDEQGLFTLESVNCVGCCSLAPVIMVNDETYGALTARKLTVLLKKLRKEALAARETDGPIAEVSQ